MSGSLDTRLFRSWCQYFTQGAGHIHASQKKIESNTGVLYAYTTLIAVSDIQETILTDVVSIYA